jgi:hypothetical protein
MKIEEPEKDVERSRNGENTNGQFHSRWRLVKIYFASNTFNK